MTKLSIILPVYNEARDISACLDSLNIQDYPNFEIIVIDDGSTDATASIVKKFPVTLLHQNHLGAGPARNLGASKASGEILVFIDADMTFAPDFLSNLVKPILTGSSKGTFSTSEFVSNPQSIWVKCWQINHNLPYNRMHSSDVSSQPVFRAILKGEFTRVGGFDTTGYTDDWTLSQKLGYPAVRASDAVFYHRQPDNLHEIWSQAQWRAKRDYKLGSLGILVGLIRASLPVSVTIGILKSIYSLTPFFIIFKIIYDAATTTSLIGLLFNPFRYKS